MAWNIDNNFVCLATPPRGNRITGLRMGTQELPEKRISSLSGSKLDTALPVDPIGLEMIPANKQPFGTGCH